MSRVFSAVLGLVRIMAGFCVFAWFFCVYLCVYWSVESAIDFSHSDCFDGDVKHTLVWLLVNSRLFLKYMK